MITRAEFKHLAKTWHPHEDWSLPDSPLWIPEHRDFVIPEWFVCVYPIKIGETRQDCQDFWDWCADNLSGKLLCYMSDTDDQEEWWGFTNQKDIVLWMLRWA